MSKIVTSSIIRLLSALSNVGNNQINKYLKVGQVIQLFSGTSPLLEVNDGSIILCGEDITDKVIAKYDKLNQELLDEKWKGFLTELGSSLLRLNHLGMSYACDDIDSEILYYKKLLDNSNFSLYEEKSGNKNTRWLFAGNINDWQSPIFELVLTANLKKPVNRWRPHFQIDIDTNLSQHELERILAKYFGKDFIKRKFKEPDYGTLFNMGMLCSIEGTKTYLGIGTDLRKTQCHRETKLKKI